MTAAQPDRLDRIEATLEVLGQRLDQTTAVAAENTVRFTELAESMLLLSQAQMQTNRNVDQLVTNVDRIIERIDEMQSEIRGLQTENRRILDRLFPE